MIGTFFKLVGKAFRFSVVRPIMRFNVYNRAKKYLGQDSKYFSPAPRAIGALSQGESSQYPHLEGLSAFKSVKQRRLEALERRNLRLLDKEKAINADGSPNQEVANKSYSEIKRDDQAVIETSSKLPVIKTVTISGSLKSDSPIEGKIETKPARPLPTSTNLQLSDPAVIWHVDKVPPGRLDVSKFQELMINKLADDVYWTPKQISDTYNIKEEHAENLIKYFKQIRIIISPRLANKLDYVARDDPLYKSYRDTIYHVDTSLRDSWDKQYDDTFLPTDDIDPEVRKVLDGAGKLQHSPDPRLTGLIKRPKPLKLSPINRPAEAGRIEAGSKKRSQLNDPKKAEGDVDLKETKEDK